MADKDERPPTSEPVRYWLGQIETAGAWHRDWHERGQKVFDRYLDKGDIWESQAVHKMNVLWSNVQTIQPALYAKAPTPKVSRRFRGKDKVGRWAATVLERAEAYELDAYDDDYHYRLGILDYLLPGRGVAWVYYEPEIADGALKWEKCCVRHINWKDFRTNAGARSWDEVFWIAKREYLTKVEAEAQGLDVDDLAFAEKKDGDSKDAADKATIWEIWDKASGKVYFVSASSPSLLRKAAPPPYRLDGFFPCARPLTATVTPDSILPVPDFVLYQNQAKEIDRLTQKINLLTNALRVAGVYDAQYTSLSSLLDDAAGNLMVPVDNWASLASQNGLSGAIDFLPLKEVFEALNQAYISREQAKQAMYEITGISDIVRGVSDAGETATAQQIKNQWGGLRIRDRQKEVQRWIRDTFRIKAEIYAEVFQPETLKSMVGVPLLTVAEKQQLQQRQQMIAQAQQFAQQNPEQAQAIVQQAPQIMQMLQPLTPIETAMLKEPAWEEVIQLLRDERLRGYRIDVETDSTVFTDEAAEKAARSEFLVSMTQFLTAMGPMVMQMPKLAPLAGAMMEFGAGAFSVADGLVSEIEEFTEGLTMEAAAPTGQQPAPPPDPKMQLEQQKGELEQKRMQHEAQMFERTAGQEQQQFAAKQGEFDANRQLGEEDREFQREQLQAKRDEAAIKAQAELQKREIEAQEKIALAQAEGMKAQEMEPFVQLIRDEIAGPIAANTEALGKMMVQIAELVAAPRRIEVSRDKQGRISGGLSTAQVAGHS